VNLEFTVKSAEKKDYYRARFWESGYSDAWAKLPD
jgi:hypothetical protein